MSWIKAKLSVVAPARPLKVAPLNDADLVWQLNLDQIEADSGRLLECIKQPYSKAGSSTHWFDERYVLYSKLRPYLNKVLLPHQRGLGTTELVPLLPDPEKLDRKYLAFYLRSKQFVEWVSLRTAGAKMPRVSMQLFWEHEIPLPPLAEQKKIAAILDGAYSLRQKDQQLVVRYTALSQSLFLEMFGDPVTNPMGWPEARLADLTTFENGDRSSNYPSGNDIKDNGVLFLSTKNITESKLDLDIVQFISEEKFRSLSRGKAKKGDLLITLRGSLGNCCIFDCEYSSAFINAQMMIIRTKNQISNLFLHSLITNRQFNSMLQVIGRGAAVQQLTATQLANLYVMTPPFDKQTLFAERIQLIEVQKQQVQRSLEKSESLFDSLLQNAFTGELTSKGGVN
ncbi:restriction endonuclease subunit S [Methylophilus flavus]|uniref:Restriction endonuclease subunit S n=1 Tax=Methylophilus flavus TaxID=640084 RepID=A0ABW3PAZ4_9PROT